MSLWLLALSTCIIVGQDEANQKAKQASGIKLQDKPLETWLEQLSSDDLNARLAAADVLRKGGEKISLPLCRILQGHDKVEMRKSAAQAIGQLGSPAKSALYALFEAVKDKDESVRSTAVSVIGDLRLESSRSVPPLVRALKDDSIEVRTTAAVALGQFGAGAKSAAPTLIAMLKDEDEDVRAAAVQGLGGIGPSGGSIKFPHQYSQSRQIC